MEDSLTLDQLRKIWSDEVRALQAGDSSPARANALANVGGKMLSSLKLEMEYARLTGKRLHIPILEAHVATE